MIEVEKAKRPSWRSQRSQLVETVENNILKYVEDFTGEKVIPEIENIVENFDLIKKRGRLSENAFQERVDNLFESFDGKIETMSDVQVGRIWNDSQLQVGAERGFKEYMSVSQRDTGVCDFCDEMDGQTFSIEPTLRNINEGEEQEFFNESDVDYIEETEDITESGLRMPWHPSCYAEGTEVYTDKGWVDFKNLAGKELFLSRNFYGEIEWVPAVRKIAYKYKGKMYSLKTNSFDLLVTPNHSQLWEKRLSYSEDRRVHEQVVSSIEDMVRESEYDIPRTIRKWRGRDQCSEKMAQFLGYYFSEGSVILREGRGRCGNVQISIAQNNTEKRKKINSLCEKLFGIGNVYFGKDKVYVVRQERLAKWLWGFGKSHEKHIPQQIKNSGEKIINSFLNCYVDGDGHTRSSEWKEKNLSSRETVIFTSSPKMAADLGESILKVGGYPSFKIRATAGTPMRDPRNRKVYLINNDQIVVSWNHSKNASSQSMVVKKVDYDSTVFDVTLSKNHILWVKYNGKTCFSGNCRCYPVFIE